MGFLEPGSKHTNFWLKMSKRSSHQPPIQFRVEGTVRMQGKFVCVTKEHIFYNPKKPSWFTNTRRVLWLERRESIKPVCLVAGVSGCKVKWHNFVQRVKSCNDNPFPICFQDFAFWNCLCRSCLDSLYWKQVHDNATRKSLTYQIRWLHWKAYRQWKTTLLRKYLANPERWKKCKTCFRAYHAIASTPSGGWVGHEAPKTVPWNSGNVYAIRSFDRNLGHCRNS